MKHYLLAAFLLSLSVTVKAQCTLSVSLSYDSLVCSYVDEDTVDTQVSGGTPPYTFQWSNGDTVSTINAMPTRTYFSVTVTDALSCSATAIGRIERDYHLTWFRVLELFGCDTPVFGNIYITIRSTSDGYVSLDGIDTVLFTSTDTTAEFYNLLPGNYTFTIYNTAGCYSEGGFLVPDSLICSGISEPSAQVALHLSPNPASDFVTLSSSKVINGVFMIRDVSGRIMRRSRLHDNNIDIELNSFSPGMYFLTVETGNNNTVTKKLVVR